MTDATERARTIIAKELRARRDFSYATDEYFLADADAILAALSAAGLRFDEGRTARVEALEEAAQVCRQEMSRARNLAAATNFENPALAAQAHIVTISREDSASRILERIRALKSDHLPPPPKDGD